MKIDKGLMGGSSTLLVLSLLAEKDCYGYEMIRTLEERSDKTFLYSEGTLYPILHKLESKGWVRSYKERTEVGRERKYYALTGLGQAQLAQEREQWGDVSGGGAACARGRIGGWHCGGGT